METINFELSKRLNDLGLLDNIETENYYRYDITNESIIGIGRKKGDFELECKTLTLEEAIEFLPKFINNGEGLAPLNYNFYYNSLQYIGPRYIYNTCVGKTFLDAVEKMLEYLLNNNLLTKNKDVQ